MTTLEFATALISLLNTIAASVTSWIRTTKHNTQVGGVPESKHLRGLAADLVLDNPDDHAALIARAQELGLTCRSEPDHVHVEAQTA